MVKERLEWVVAALLVGELTNTLVSTLGGRLPGIGDFVQLHEVGISVAVSVISMILLVVALVVLRSDKNTISTMKADFETLNSNNDKLRRFVEKFTICGRIYRTLAKENAECDWELFHLLFLDKNRDVIKSIGVVRNNIQYLVDSAAAVYLTHTGRVCSVCLQLIERVDGKTLDDAVIKTILRDKLSAENRNPPVGQHAVRDNSYHRKIFIDRADHVVENDLRSAMLRGDFQTSSKNWDGSYNAMLIMPIPNMPLRNGMPHGDEERHVPRATLCVDSLEGIFEGDVHVHIARELAWRIAVMIYRLEALERVADP